MTSARLLLRGVRREYLSGEGVVAGVKNIDLDIHAGEYVAVIGASGSGKTTLMNILGCLDRPTSGTYHVAGRDTAKLARDDLAELRRAHFGFILQRSSLLPDLTALENTELPAIYARKGRAKRRAAAAALLGQLMLGHRLGHRPGQLSGGQQQRVSIARALINGGEVILADEPTGALDSHVGGEVLDLFKQLHLQGHTIIVVTHDANVARHAERIIELRDGEITSDSGASFLHHTTARFWQLRAGSLQVRRFTSNRRRSVRATRSQALVDALRMALHALRAHRLRTFLTMLGIVIGITSVALVVALVNGGRERMLADIRGIGTNTLDIYPGKDLGDETAANIRTLTSADADALTRQDYVTGVTPTVSTMASMRYGNSSLSGSINGVGNEYFRVHNAKILRGAPFSEADIHDLAQVAVIDDIARQRLFPHNEDPLGRVIFVGKMPVRVIGIISPAGNIFAANQNLNVWLPYTAVMGRMLGPSSLRNITARIADDAPIERASAAVTRLLTARHGRRDFFLFSADTVRKAVESTTTTMALLIASIAVITLIVGGLGVMNIMLVSVAERTREIGIRMAVGARQRDIQQQFLVESVTVCLIGGVLGVVLALGIGFVYSRISTQFSVKFSASSITAALAVSTVVGGVFGYLPARRAALLDPITALASE